MKLSQLLDTTKLTSHINDRIVNVQHHHFLPLSIYNYGQRAQFEGIWDDITCHTRGLIVDQSTDEIIARPFQKFFNLGHMGRPETNMENLPATLPEITEKLDGSLGILYKYKEFTGIASRGSFASDQAAWASTYYSRFYSAAAWPEGWTPIFEIIYPDNRIVVKYEREGLFLLALKNIETGEEAPYSDLDALALRNNIPTVKLHTVTLDEARADNQDNFEGYVATWPTVGVPPFKVKIKLVEYCRLHRLLTGISPKEIWRMLKDGDSFESLFENVPQHYSDWVNYWKNGLQSEFGRIEQKAKAIWTNCDLPKDGHDKDSRKKLAEFFTMGDRKDVSGILFKMLDDCSYDETIWRLVRGKTRDQEPFKRETE